MKLLFLMLLILCGCARAGAEGYTAQMVASPTSGYRCFVIVNGQGQAVGGNCLREE